MPDAETEYYKICANRYLHPLAEGEYGEVHHILPRSLGGMDISQNLVRLTPEEHYRVHELLPFIYTEGKEHRAMVHAWNMMRGRVKGLKIDSETYGRLRREFSKAHSEAMTGKRPWIAGKHHTEETRRLISALQRGKKRGHCSEETKRKISEAKKGRKPSPQTIEANRRRLMGSHQSEETKQKRRESLKRYWENKGKEHQKCLGVT